MPPCYVYQPTIIPRLENLRLSDIIMTTNSDEYIDLLDSDTRDRMMTVYEDFGS